MKKISILLALFVGAFHAFAQVTSNDTLHWSDAKPLTWNDFKGDVVDSVALSGDAVIAILASEKKGSRFAGTSTYVVTVFDWRNSWVKPKADTEMFLKYFQVLFDMGELYSRKLRKSIKEADLDPYPVSFNEKYMGAKIGLNDRVKQFKKESKNGTYEIAITRWYDNVKAELTELDGFKQAPVKTGK
ncbi:MAG: hypothetical protein Q8L81_14610 [Bacteroidota bacterium]|nr:hypothetical protein [Bacteroidota bacterium]